MRIIGWDLHARQQTLAVLDVATGEIQEHILEHEGNAVRDFYSRLEGGVRVGIEATGSMHWFLELMNELVWSARSDIQPRFGPASRESKSTIGVTPCCY